METINQMATAAAKVVWGDADAKKEPISGIGGDVSNGEPYDAGNLDSAKQRDLESRNVPNEDHAKQRDLESRNVPNEDHPMQRDLESRTAPAENPLKPKELASSGPVSASENPAKTNASVPNDSTAGQNDTRSPENPQTTTNPAKHEVNDSGEGPNDTVDFDAPGPKPIAQVAKEHGGDAGNLGKDGKDGEKAEKASISSSSSSSSSEEELPKGPTNEKKKPTGQEEVVKSSGLVADGGDFDASNPGAGVEADRLMEEKGIRKESGPTKDNGLAVGKTASNGSAGSNSPKEKVSLKDKIKAKLHSH